MKTETKAMNLTEAETKEIEKDVASIDVNRANFEYIAKTGKINGNLLVDIKRLVTAMAEKKNLETKVWKNTADEFKKYNADLKAQLEATQEEIDKAWNAANEYRNESKAAQVGIENLKSEYDKVVDHEWKLDAELKRVKEVAKRIIPDVRTLVLNGLVTDAFPQTVERLEQAMTEFANLMNKEK